MKCLSVPSIACAKLVPFFCALLMLSVSLTAQAGNKKEEQRKRIALLEQLINMANSPWEEVPEIIFSDQKAFDYCSNILACSDEQYTQDTTTVNEWFNMCSWVAEHQTIPEPKELKKKSLRGYNESQLVAFYNYVQEQTWKVAPRYQRLAEYCERMIGLRRVARQRSMPTGNIRSLEYREFGSSRPSPVHYKIECDTVSGTIMLSGYKRDELEQKAVGNNVLQQLRTIVEEHAIYKELDCYVSPPSFPECPTPVGGSPSWSFRCVLDGGVVCTDAESWSIPRGCEAVRNYLHQILEEE